LLKNNQCEELGKEDFSGNLILDDKSYLKVCVTGKKIIYMSK